MSKEKKIKPRVCLVTTVKNPTYFDTFLEYHLAIGVEHIYVFFDDPKDQWIPIVEKKFTGRVSIFRSTTTLRHKQLRSTQLFGLFDLPRDWSKLKPVDRQLLNIETVIQKAVKKGLNWLIQIDHDELIYCPSSLTQYLSKIPREVGQILLENHEAVPEEIEVGNYFQNVTLFKRNFSSGRIKIKPRIRKAIKSFKNVRGDYFFGYDQGKSIARLSPDLLPDGIHYFKTSTTHPVAIYGHPLSILHYQNSGFDEYLTKLHLWLNKRTDGLGKDGHFSRAQTLLSQGKFNELLLKYRFQIAMTEKSDVKRWMRSGIMARFTKPSRLFKRT